MMADLSIRLTYPPSLFSTPVINRLIRNYDLTVNILKAQVNADEGWLEVQLSGEKSVLDEAVRWLENQGIEIMPVMS